MTPVQITMFVIACAAAFVLLWFLICYFAAYFSGWHRLAEQFQSTNPFAGPEFRLWHVAMRFYAHYDNVIYLGADPEDFTCV
jgi:hypothetical protein